MVIDLLTTIAMNAEAAAKLAVVRGQDRQADHLFRIADSAIAMLRELIEAPA